jgi:hypothetical protein
MQQVEDFYRKSGIVVPLISNDGFNYGNFVPGFLPVRVRLFATPELDGRLLSPEFQRCPREAKPVNTVYNCRGV